MDYPPTTPENVFFQLPHVFKPLQSLNAVILVICLGSATGVSGNGVVWFVVVASLIISVFATVLFALKIHDSVLHSLTGGSLPWELLEMIYSFVLSVLNALSMWLAFGFVGRVHEGDYYGGYVAAGIFLIIQSILYLVPTILIYNKIQVNRRSEYNDPNPYAEGGYQTA
uniref:MARVEL domain-containing protein n=1 Tax=Steinernema glaseri TaxID=37863 RepID=A0A1I7YM85_9BILA